MAENAEQMIEEIHGSQMRSSCTIALLVGG